MYKSTNFISDDVVVFNLNQEDLGKMDFGIHLLQTIKKYSVLKVVFDLSYIDIISSKDINDITKLVNILKLNNIKSIACGINPYSASLLPHFIENVKFQTTLGIKEAISAF